jgi:hypothetical protein
MKRTNYHPRTFKRLCAIIFSCLQVISIGIAAPPSESSAKDNPRVRETKRDLPGDFHKYYGQRSALYRDKERKLAKLDIDGDMNYDGKIDNWDPADNGAFQQTPPGLVVGAGEMSKLILRLTPYRVDFRGEAVVTLEVAGINRAEKSGEFNSLDEELSATGKVKIWKDISKKKLLIDSSDPAKRHCEWVVDDTKYPANLPGIVPRTVYVEGISPSKNFTGDIRVLVTVSHRDRGSSREGFTESRKKLLKRFRTSFDHILLTVNPKPHKKDYINANAEKVWSSP